MKILGTGLSGMLGSRITELLSYFVFTNLSRSGGFDITDKESLRSHFADFSGKYVLHAAAKASVDGCEADKNLGENGEAWRINVLGTENIAALCREFHKKIIYISTDFVFNGEKEKGASYREDDSADPINWYGATKYEGEKKVLESGADYAILRIAYPYGISSAPKKDFVKIISERLKSNQSVEGITDHIFVPTFIDDIAYSIKIMVEKDVEGVFHGVGSQALSPYDAAISIAQSLKISPEVIKKTTRAEYFKDKAPRPFNLDLNNAKIENLGVSFRPFTDGISGII